MVFQNMVVMERCKGEIEVQKDAVDTIFGVKKMNLFGVIGNGLHN